MPEHPQDRLVRKEVALGVIREYEPPKDHIGLRLLAPWQEVGTDDVIFDYLKESAVGMAPARAEDSESELAGKDEFFGTGRASIIDWAIKDHYDASDVQRYRESLIAGGLAGAEALPLTVNNVTEDFNQRMARDTARRRRRLDNRIEWLIMNLMDNNEIVYDDGKIAFTVAGNRPAAQHEINIDTAPGYSGEFFGEDDSDPIGDILYLKEQFDPQIDFDRALISRRAFRKLYLSPGFVDALTGSNPLYKVSGWGPKVAAEFIQEQVEMEFIIYDSVYSTRALGSQTVTHNRFMRENMMIFLPSQATIDNLDDAIGFGKTLTSPHPEGGWTPGYYEWEKDTGPDPWGQDFGAGVKAFPVMPHLDKTASLQVLAT